ncbi:amino acid permease [Paraburkholderia sp. UCT70]|uniref:amino acid permease n=1 Tax=Paraburkholderia sp. UCT70 TaxID=2991068 RepID=UPI003D1DDA52
MDKRVRLSAPGLMAMVIGSMVGVGVFSLPQALGKYTGVVGSLISWTITGSGMLILALIFQRLAWRKPELDAGVYTYARVGFGRYTGFSVGVRLLVRQLSRQRGVSRADQVRARDRRAFIRRWQYV